MKYPLFLTLMNRNASMPYILRIDTGGSPLDSTSPRFEVWGTVAPQVRASLKNRFFVIRSSKIIRFLQKKKCFSSHHTCDCMDIFR